MSSLFRMRNLNSGALLSRNLFVQKRSESTTLKRDSRSNPAVVLDIDGVLVKGDMVLEQGKKALRYLNGENPLKKKIPHIFMTNSGGISEEDKAKELSEGLGIEVNPGQVMLSHSPMRQLVPAFKEKTVLVVGGKSDKCAEIARSYGFENVVSPHEIHNWIPPIWQFSTLQSRKETKDIDFHKTQIAAILMFHDTYDFGRDLQIVMDVLRCKDGVLGNAFCEEKTQTVPLWVSNQDFVFSNEFHHPRFAQGAFHECLKALWKKCTGRELSYSVFGKPHKQQYLYAEQLLSSWIDLMNPKSLASQNITIENHSIYAIGDNPLSDIVGANRQGWGSVLVRTGVYNEKTHALHPELHQVPSHIADDVYEAVKWIAES